MYGQAHFKKSCGAHTARFFKYVWSFFNIMHENIKQHVRFVYFEN